MWTTRALVFALEEKDEQKKNELYHHGVKGMKWGVRHDRKRDTFLKAAQYAQRQANRDRTNAKDYSQSPNKYKKKYFSNGKPNTTKWLTDMYGSDWKNHNYMKEVFDVDDVHAHAKNEINRDFKDLKTESSRMSKLYIDSAKNWEAQANKFMNTPISDLSRKDYKYAKKLAKRYSR